MPTGAAVCCARKSHYESQGKPVPTLTLKQSALLVAGTAAATALGVAGVAAGSRVASSMRSAPSVQKLFSDIAKAPGSKGPKA